MEPAWAPPPASGNAELDAQLAAADLTFRPHQNFDGTISYKAGEILADGTFYAQCSSDSLDGLAAAVANLAGRDTSRPGHQPVDVDEQNRQHRAALHARSRKMGRRLVRRHVAQARRQARPLARQRSSHTRPSSTRRQHRRTSLSRRSSGDDPSAEPPLAARVLIGGRR